MKEKQIEMLLLKFRGLYGCGNQGEEWKEGNKERKDHRHQVRDQ